MTIVTKGVKKRALASLSTRSSVLPVATTVIPWQDTTNKSSSISAPFGGSNIVATVNSQFAGSLSSITWNGVEFVNSWDHGREFQSAMTFDGLGECSNPTEAGSRADLFSNVSSSVLRSLSSGSSQLITTSSPAYWLVNGETNGVCTSTIPSQPSNVLFSKTVDIGIPSAANVIKYAATYTIPDAHTSANFEILAGYTRGRTFVNFWNFDPVTNVLTAATVPQGGGIGGSVPFVLSSADGNFAVGVSTRRVASVSYAASNFTDAARSVDNATTKIGCLTARTNIAAGSVWPFTCYIAVGTIADVQIGMRAVQANE